jgi:dephospho-CoA kinase
VPVYDCDTEAKRLICEDESVRQKLITLAGPDIFREGTLQKHLLADFIFTSPLHVRQVNGIVHPAVREDFRKWVGRQTASVVAMESAILYESGLDTEVDDVLYVDAPEELRIRRAMRRDGSNRMQIESRIRMQQPEAQKQKARYVIDNTDATPESLLESLQQILQRIATEQKTE